MTRKAKGKVVRRMAMNLLVVEVSGDTALATLASFTDAMLAVSGALAEESNLDTTIERDGAVARVKVKHR
jgi:hypothetical protein